jgi:hypothetical protein
MTSRWRLYTIGSSFLAAAAVAAIGGPVQSPDPADYLQRSRQFSERMESTGLAESFRGITTNGTIVPRLYEIRSTGVSTEPVREAALAFLNALNGEQREQTTFPIGSDEWRKWANQHIYYREGISFEEMSPEQRSLAFGMLGASLSARGLELTRDIMRLNETLGELNGNNFVEYGEWKYWISVMGEPSATEPWGWQLDGHHLNLNYFVMGDQVVMTPAFWGSEPTVAESGKYAGTMIMVDEQDRGLDLMRSLDADQRATAVIEVEKTGNNIMTQAFSDNVVLDYAGIRGDALTDSQKEQLLELVGVYVGNMREGHARVRMSQVEEHIDDTYFAWIGEWEEDSVFYYRIQSPVILIEFDHETPVGLRHIYPPDVPYKEHIHAVVRTPNGNDYGQDLLRQHYEQHPHGD